jgi:hypothetical protein
MTSISRSFSARIAAILVIAAGITWIATRPRGSARSSDSEIQVKTRVGQGPSGDLLALAFDAATAVPVTPLLKERSRLQEEVVMAAFDVGRQDLALVWTDAIEDWRRGTCHAESAYRKALAGEREGVEAHLEIAAKLASDHEKTEAAQDWQRDRTRSRIERTRALLDGSAKAASRESRAAESDLEAMGETLAKGNIDEIRSALDACIEMFAASFRDSARRARVEAVIEAGRKKLPPEMGLEVCTKLAEISFENRDSEKTSDWLARARAMLEGTRWLPEDRIKQAARLAVTRHECGAAADARKGLDAALAAYAFERERIVDIYRAGVLRAIAEGYHAIGDRDTALDVYRKALDDGLGNPNSFPRAEDLVATSLSMARRGIVPDEAFWERLRNARRQLGTPW